jgi:hypothetical protein
MCTTSFMTSLHVAAPPSNVMNSRRFMSDLGLAPPPYTNAGHQKVLAVSLPRT